MSSEVRMAAMKRFILFCHSLFFADSIKQGENYTIALQEDPCPVEKPIELPSSKAMSTAFP
jgi:hypothetical protein